MSEGYRRESVLDSASDAFTGSNILYKFVMFVIFGIVTAFPYLVYNLDQVSLKVAETGVTGLAMLWQYLLALGGASKTGFFIGLSSLFDTLIRFPEVWSQRLLGTLGFSLLVLIFATATVFQPLRLLLNAIDMKKGRHHSRAMVVFFSVIVVLLLSPLAWLIMDGETLTTGIEDEQVVDTITEDLVNITESIVEESPIINLLEEPEEELINETS
jgi:hypothetical protein